MVLSPYEFWGAQSAFSGFRVDLYLKKVYLSRNTRLYNFDPLKSHFYIVKSGLQGYILFFLFLLKNIDCGYSLEPPRRGGSNDYPQSWFQQKYEEYQNFFI